MYLNADSLFSTVYSSPLNYWSTCHVNLTFQLLEIIIDLVQITRHSCTNVNSLTDY